MGRIEFPTTPIGAAVKIGTAKVGQDANRPSFVQSTLEGVETEQKPEIELGNCLVTAAVRFRKLVRGMSGIARYMLHLICFILNKREILRHMHITAPRI
jgi:hypothetical protein